MAVPIVDLRNIDIAIWRREDGAMMCRIVTRSPTGKTGWPVQFEIDDSPKLFRALSTIGETDRVLSGEKV